jgi:hypothetical protein
MPLVPGLLAALSVETQQVVPEMGESEAFGSHLRASLAVAETRIIIQKRSDSANEKHLHKAHFAA